ncbi:hypothetical protein DCC77_02115 [Candidatus Uhrbacteria bacterium]|nr:MAG: hypothetical protein DCC77_02115 [Candidatus Uhrbacteria bacterium]
MAVKQAWAEVRAAGEAEALPAKPAQAQRAVLPGRIPAPAASPRTGEVQVACPGRAEARQQEVPLVPAASRDKMVAAVLAAQPAKRPALLAEVD